MNLAVTLVIQGIVFFAVAWVLKILFWSDIMLAIETRQKKIADGLAAASKSEKDLDEAQARSKEIIREARDRAAQIVDQARQALQRDRRGSQGHGGERGAAPGGAGAGRGRPRKLRARAKVWPAKWASWPSKARRGCCEREIDPKTHAELLDKLAAEVARG